LTPAKADLPKPGSQTVEDDSITEATPWVQKQQPQYLNSPAFSCSCWRQKTPLQQKQQYHHQPQPPTTELPAAKQQASMQAMHHHNIKHSSTKLVLPQEQQTAYLQTILLNLLPRPGNHPSNLPTHDLLIVLLGLHLSLSNPQIALVGNAARAGLVRLPTIQQRAPRYRSMP
jgi:hypothetical protein